MALTNEKMLQILSGYAPPGEQVLLAAKARWVLSTAGKAAAAVLISPIALQGVECLVGASDRNLIHLPWNFLSSVLKPKAAQLIPFQDIASYEFKPGRLSSTLELLLRDGKKTRFTFDPYPSGNLEMGSQLAEFVATSRGKTGFQAQPASPSARPAKLMQAAAPMRPATPPDRMPPKNTQARSTASTLACRNCGQTVDNDSSFCESCGAKVNCPAPGVCPGCGQPVNPSAKFCRSCGGKLKG
jgi:hypothetical protein